MQWQAPQTLASSENFFLTPIFIQNFNHLSYLHKLVRWLLAAGYENICVIDNHSTYAPLLQFYADVESKFRIRIVRRDVNGSRTTLWEERLLEKFGVRGPFVYTDSDVVPDESCPTDVVARLAALLRENACIFKAGLGLRIDDLPSSYRHRDQVVTWERKFWTAPVCRGAFLAEIDTTFALYRPNSSFAMAPALRTGWPYLARHETWYQDSSSPSEEQRYYVSEIEKTSRGHWARTRLPSRLERQVANRANSNLRLLNLACGCYIIPGWINVDRDAASGTEIVFDLENCAKQSLPMAGDSIDGLFMCRGFSRINAVLPMMQELYRIAKAGARFIIRIRPDRARGGMAHERLYALDDFARYGQPARAGSDDDYNADWRIVRMKVVADPSLINSEGEARALERVARQPDLIRELIIELRAVKPPRPRQPDLQERPALTIGGTGFDSNSDFHAAL
jgi:hypothetical protein